jgi:hypothetical protein
MCDERAKGTREEINRGKTRQSNVQRVSAKLYIILMFFAVTPVYAADISVPTNPQIKMIGVQETNPNETMLSIPAYGAGVTPAPTPSMQSTPRAPPAPPPMYAPIYKCSTAKQTTYQGTPCNGVPTVPYRVKDIPIMPEY